VSAPPAGPSRPYALGPTVPLLAGLTFLVAYGSTLPLALAFAVAVVGIGAGVGLRGMRHPIAQGLFAVPPLVALGLLAAFGTLAPLALLLTGLAGVGYVAWLADDPARPRGGARRGLVVWAVPALGVLVGWAGTFLLPSGAASLGVAGALAAAAVGVLAYLVSRPDLFDPDAAATL